MKTASITEAKNRLSALLDLVRAGESVLIVDRGVPVARLVPAVKGEGGVDAGFARLERAGLIRLGGGSGKAKELVLSTPPPKGRGRLDIVETVLEERREGY